MTKLELILFYVSVFGKLALSEGDFGDGLPTKGKASLFLQNKAIPGLDASVSPEDIISQTKDNLFPGISPFERSNLRSTVPGGNFPELDLQIIKPKIPESKKKAVEEDSADSPIGQQALVKKLILLDPVEELLLGRYFNITAGNNETVPTDQADLIEPQTPADGLASFVKRLVDCQLKLVECSKKKVTSCYLHCLLNYHPIGKVVKSNVNALIRTLCNPLGTVFDGAVKLYNKHFDSIKSINHFLTMLGIKTETFKRFTRLAANALPTIILKYAKVQGSDLFKAVISGLESDSKAVAISTTDVGKELINPACSVLETFNAVQRVVGVIYQNPKTVEVALTGLWMLSKVFNLIEAPLLKGTLQAVGGMLSMLIGINCGLVHYIQTGSNSTCKEDDGIRWEATEQELVPRDAGISLVCGAVPYISPRAILDDLFPPIFSQDTKTVSSPPQTNDDSDGTNLQQRSGSNGNPMELNWLAGVIKTIDTDDDV